MKHFQLARFIGILGLLCGCTGHTELSEPFGTEVARLKFPELSQEPLAPAVSLTTILRSLVAASGPTESRWRRWNCCA